MVTPARRRATYADLAGLPDTVVGELIAGEVVVSPRPAPRHAVAAVALSGELYGRFGRGRGGPDGRIVLIEPELHLGGDVLVPDLAGWRRSRMPTVPATAAFELSPDWVCEVLSPSTASIDRVDKVPAYARERVGHVWLVDPILQTLEVLALDGAGYRLAGTWKGEARVHAEPFAEVELELAALWTA